MLTYDCGGYEFCTAPTDDNHAMSTAQERRRKIQAHPFMVLILVPLWLGVEK